jgi:hypothetical protein
MNEQDDLTKLYTKPLKLMTEYGWHDNTKLFPSTPTGRMPKVMRVKGCYCYTGWKSQSAAHQVDSNHLAYRFKVNDQVLRGVYRLGYRLATGRYVPTGVRNQAYPSLEVAVELAVCLHLANQLGLYENAYRDRDYVDEQYQIIMNKLCTAQWKETKLRDMLAGRPLIRWKDADSDVVCTHCGGTGWDYIWVPDGGKPDDWFTIGNCCYKGEDLDETN